MRAFPNLQRIFSPALLALALAAHGQPSAANGIAYNRDVRPILSENCFACHGPDSASRKAGLRLDNFAGATNKLEIGRAHV